MASPTSETGRWLTRYPDLAGKTMIVAGESSYLLEVTQALAGNGVLLAIVAPDRDLVEAAVALAEAESGVVFGITADPSAGVVWQRVAPHIEQRLGPGASFTARDLAACVLLCASDTLTVPQLVVRLGQPPA